MAEVNSVAPVGTTEKTVRIPCDNEDRELQQLLEKNFDLLPGDQIDPNWPRRWMLVNRESPVPGPSSGLDRWSFDFLLVNQDLARDGASLSETENVDATLRRLYVVMVPFEVHVDLAASRKVSAAERGPIDSGRQ